jgi:hypothetical protein
VCNSTACASTYYKTAPVSVTLTAADTGGSGVAGTYYTTDGSTPTTASTKYTAAIGVSTNTKISYFAVDLAGNAGAVQSQQLQVDAVAPVTSATCNGAPCGAGWVKTGPVTVVLAAADTGGSGVASTRYTTNGTTPTATSPLYTAPFSVTASGTTVKFFSTDVAGNAEAVKSFQVRFDTTAPVSAITCNNVACTKAFNAAVTVRLTSTDSQSGVAVIRYTTDGTAPTATSTAYTAPFTVAATSTVRYAATDVVGNVETAKSQVVTLDTTKPTVTVLTPSNGARITRSLLGTTLAATASDALSGIASVQFYVDGNKVGSADTSSPYTASWSTLLAASGAHVITAIATDGAGNTGTSAPVTVTLA